MAKTADYRSLTSEEIKTLTDQDCSSADWSKVQVAEGFKAVRVRNTHFAGEVKLGSNEGVVAGDAGVEALLLALAQESEGQRRGQLAEGAARLLEAHFHRYEEMIAPAPLLNGHAVMNELGLAPGPKVGELLAALREAQAAGEVCTRGQAWAFVRKLLSGC